MFVTVEETKIINAALRFANLKRIRTTAQVENIFKKLPLVGGVFKILQPGEEGAYKKDQARLRDWLEKIARGSGDVAGEVHVLLRTIDASVVFNSKAERLEFAFGLSGVEACCAFAVALILDTDKRLRTRLGHCDAPGCGRFRLDHKGKPWKFCNEDHREAADRAGAKKRVKDWRDRQKKG